MSFSRRRNAGFSLTEVLVVLAILALAVAVFASARPGPSPVIQQQARMSALIDDAARTQQTAMTQGTTQTYMVPDPVCDHSAQTLVFFSNGTAQPAEICLKSGQQEHWLTLDPFTGQLIRRSAP